MPSRVVSLPSYGEGDSRRPPNKQWGGPLQFKLRGTDKVSAVFALHVIAYNLIRLGNLLRPAAMEAA